MKKYNNKTKVYAAGIALVSLLASCGMDEPFKSEIAGDTLVKMNVSFNNELTRAVDSQAELENGCTVYIANANGLLHKWVGVNNIPSSIYMRYGSYTAEALAGDSVAASFSDKYYKGLTHFEVGSNQVTTQVTIPCKIANVVTSLDLTDFPVALHQNLKVTVSSSTGSLVFEDDKLFEKGYFMRNYDESSQSYDSSLNFTIEGIDRDGSTFTKNGVIEDVKPAHEYKLTLIQRTDDTQQGGAFIQLVVKEFELEVDSDIVIHSHPEFAWLDSDLPLDGQIFDKSHNFMDHSLLIGAYDDFKSIVLSTDNPEIKAAMGGVSPLDIVGMEAEMKTLLEAKGICFLKGYSATDCNYRILFEDRWLNDLPDSPNEYIINVTATDSRGLTNSMKVRIANTDAAKGMPFSLNTDNLKNPLAVKANSAQIVVDLQGEVENLAVQYKKSTDNDWETLKIENLSRSSHTVVLRGLQEKTTYEIRLVGGEITGNDYQFESDIETFTTEEKYKIPNAGMEDWHQNSSKWEISTKEDLHTFWDSGNDASALAKLTEPSSDYYHGGEKSAKLKTSKTMGMITAGNLFAGKFGSIGSGFKGASLTFGREYNGSHPKSLKVYARYSPTKVSVVNSNCPDQDIFQTGILDHGQIFIALATAISDIDTSTGIMFDPTGDNIIAYGQHTWTEAFEPAEGMGEVEIELNYYDKANTQQPTHIIIVASSSKYGDYFSGGEGSTLYLDDFELVYE